MNRQLNRKTTKKSGSLLAGVAILLLSGLLAGCSHPSDADITRLMAESYTCKGLEITGLVKDNSMSGIYSSVEKYNFQVRIAGGEKEALAFYQNLFALAGVKDDNWKAAVNAPKVQAYLLEECTESGQTAVENLFDDVLTQMAEKKSEIRLPLVIPIKGWSEFMPGKHGWEMTMHRDRFDDQVVYSEPVKRELLLPKPEKTQKKKHGKK